MRIDPERDFGVRECPSCGVKVASNQNNCSICGYAFLQPDARQRGMRLWGALIMLALILFLTIALYLN
jgi:predicted nucleic acid-binding Zn ribbon protein